MECKSYLDSRGVALRAFDGSDAKFAERFKLFSDDNLRNVVFVRLRKQLAACGACAPNAAVKLCLACGRIATTADREGLHKHFTAKGWDLWDESCSLRQAKRANVQQVVHKCSRINVEEWQSG